MNVLLVFTLLLLCSWGQVIVVLAAKSLLNLMLDIMPGSKVLPTSAYQVMVGEVSNVTGLNTKVLESLGLRINGLVNKFPLYLIS